MTFFTTGPSPTTSPLAWAEAVAAREGVQPRNSRDLLAMAERYAGLYPGGPEGLARLAKQIARPMRKKARVAGGLVADTARAVKKHPAVGQAIQEPGWN